MWGDFVSKPKYDEVFRDSYIVQEGHYKAKLKASNRRRTTDKAKARQMKIARSVDSVFNRYWVKDYRQIAEYYLVEVPEHVEQFSYIDFTDYGRMIIKQSEPKVIPAHTARRKRYRVVHIAPYVKLTNLQRRTKFYKRYDASVIRQRYRGQEELPTAKGSYRRINDLRWDLF